MKRKITFLLAVIMLLTMINLPEKVIGQTTITFSSASSTTGGHVTVACAIGSGQNAPLWSDPNIRLYANNTITITPDANYQITRLEYSFYKQGNKAYASSTLTSSDGSYADATSTSSSDEAVAVWTGSTTNAVVITLGSSGQRSFRQVVVTASLVSSDPTLTIASVTGGTIAVTNTSTSASVTSGSKVAATTGLTLSNNPSTGYSFSSWNVYKTGDQTTTVTVTNNQFTMPSYNTTVSATFTKNNYDVTLGTPDGVALSASDLGEISIDEGETEAVPYGTELLLTAGSMASGKMFAWSVTKTSGGDDVTASVLSNVSADEAILTVPDYAVTVSGTVEDIKYYVTYDANGGTGTLVDPNSPYTPGDDVTVLANTFTYSGHAFTKWNTEAGGGGTDYDAGDEISDIAADVTLYAQWADAWTVTLNSNAVTTINEVEKEQSITLTDPDNTPSGYVFKWWTATPSTPQINVSTTYTPTANVTLYAVFAKTVQEYAEKTILIDGSLLRSADEYTSSINRTYDGISYTLAPSSASNKVKRVAVPGTASNEFTGVDSTILIGKNGAYIKNNIVLGEGITKFEIYENKGASASADIGLNFSSSVIASYSASATYKWTQSVTPDNVYDASSALPPSQSRAKYFWFQVTGSANAQVAFKITYIAPVYYTRIYPSGTTNASEDITISSPTIIQSGTVLNMGAHELTNTTAANLIIEDGGQLILAKTNTGVAATVKKNVTKATPGSKTDATYWYAISAGVETPSIIDNTNLITETSTPYHYDLYRFNEEENAGNAWENYRAHSTGVGADFTTLEKGRGYLYRNASDLTITMTGDINVEDFEYDVTKTDNGEYAGFNLIGNPYTHDIYKGAGTAITSGASTLSTGFYYLEPSTGKWAKGTDKSTAIAPNQGILVQVNKTGKINMTNTNSNGGVAKSNNDYIMLSVANSQYSDEAYAWFDEGIGLNKIEHRNSEIPMLYINQNDENFAIATMSDETQSFNLNFKAATMGKYTLSYKAKGEYNYLHVIDRLTGEDVDMLLDGEYSFIGAPTDNDNRFIVKLCYNANSNATDYDIFAYQSGSDIIVNGEGELQIFDVTGRKVATQHVNGVETINLQLQGVYIFKLNEKVQKIVVR